MKNLDYSSTIPAETLTTIFTFVQAEGAWVKEDPWPWTHILGVCRRWREIAIATPRLWTEIHTFKLEGVSRAIAYVERSKAANLYVHHTRPGSSPPLRCLLLVLAHLPRIKTLNIQHCGPLPLELKNALKAAAPKLVELTLSTLDDSFDLPTLFDRNTPMLKDLSIFINAESMDTWADAPIAKDLRKLSIICGQTSAISIGEIDLAISRNPELELLSLVGYREKALPHPVTLPKSLQPASLKELNLLEATYRPLRKLFQLTTFPARLNWRVQCQNYPLARDPPADPMCLVPNTLGNEYCDSVALNICPAWVKIKGLGSPGRSALENPSDTNRLRRCLKLSWENSVWMNLTDEAKTVKGFAVSCALLTRKDWNSATQLTVQVETENFDLLVFESWRTLLESLPSLQDLTVRRVDSFVIHRSNIKETYLQLVRALVNQSPRLSTLHLCGANLTDEFTEFADYLALRTNRLNELQLCQSLGVSRNVQLHLYEKKVSKRITLLDGVHIPAFSRS